MATFFGDSVDKFEPLIKENSVYLFSNGQIKMSNKKYTSIANDHCITFDMNAEIEEIEDDTDIKT